jgi:hypothetical protein
MTIVEIRIERALLCRARGVTGRFVPLDVICSMSFGKTAIVAWLG